MRRIIIFFLIGATAGGCYPETERFCDKRAVCWVDTDKVKWSRKHENVEICYQSIQAEPARLRAQNMPACDEAADALEEFYNCLTGVDCPQSEESRDQKDVWCLPELRRRTDRLSCKIFPNDTRWHNPENGHEWWPPAIVREWW